MDGWGWGVHVPLPTWRGAAGMYPVIGAVTAVHRVNLSIPAVWTPPLGKVSKFHENVTSAREEEGWH